MERCLCHECKEKFFGMDKTLELLEDVVHQACWDGEQLDTMCIGAYEDAISYLVAIGRARWIKRGRLAVWVEDGE